MKDAIRVCVCVRVCARVHHVVGIVAGVELILVSGGAVLGVMGMVR